MTESFSLFDEEREQYRPLADRLRPISWDDFQGLELVNKSLLEQLRSGRGNPPSLILWGPPGCGKTTFAKLVGNSYNCRFVEFSAVLGGVKEVREIVAEAKKSEKRTILFIDEIHRFNRGQQDAFLPHVENGTIILIGATTENPSFYLTGALRSRVKVLTFPSLSEKNLLAIAKNAISALNLQFNDDALELLCSIAGGDARRLLNFIESFNEAHSKIAEHNAITIENVRAFLQDAGTKLYDRTGEEHYNTISAFIKSLRGSDPDAALFYCFWMLDAGEDPRFIIRRMIVFASEDIGNADPRALQVAVATYQAHEIIGMPEAQENIAQCVTYLATAPKSNRSYMAMNAVKASLKKQSKIEIPLYLRNAPTKLMEELGYSKGYEYPHDTPDGFAPSVRYLPESVKDAPFYEPTERGYEKMIGERMRFWKELRDNVKKR